MIAAAVNQRHALDPFRNAIARVIGSDHPDLDLLVEITPAEGMAEVPGSQGGASVVSSPRSIPDRR